MKLFASCSLLLVSTFGLALLPASGQAARPAGPKTILQADRIADDADLRPSTVLAGHQPRWAAPGNDRGPVAATKTLRLSLVLSRAPEVQSAFQQLLADQQNPTSPRFHQWLTPQQIGETYGPTQHDVDALTAWLGSQGIRVDSVAPSRIFVEASAPASVLERALSTTFRYYTIPGATDGGTHFGPSVEPTLPTVFAGFVSGMEGLADIPVAPQHHMRVVEAPAAGSVSPMLTTTSGNHYVTPNDFATIYGLTSVYAGGIQGAGQRIAVIGRSRVATTDISAFETNTGIAANLPRVVIPPSGTDPGVTGDGNQDEATLDVGRTIGTAPGAQTDLVISSISNGGISLAAQYNVQTLLDPVMTISFGACEANASAQGVAFWDALFSQGAAEGISTFVSSGDSGAAGCDAHGVAPPTTTQFASTNYICSSSYATCVGGTQFVDTANPAQYWSTTNQAGFSSALSYIPEGGWNEPSSYNSTTGVTSYRVGASGGGVSKYIAKPGFQTGTGVPADGFRDTPDVSFTASGHDGYYACLAYIADCATGHFVAFSGTSASAPGMAGIAALLNQKIGVAQGNLNPLLYRLAADNSNNVFHDITVDTSAVSGCAATTPSLCNNSTPSATTLTGGLSGFLLTAGYDQVTGLGSLNVANLLTAAISPTLTLGLTLTESATTITSAQTVVFTAKVTADANNAQTRATGSVQFAANGVALGAPLPLAGGMVALPATRLPAAGTYSITANYLGDTSFKAASAAALSLVVTPSNLPATSLSIVGTAASATTQQTVGYTATVTSAASGSPTGTVQFYDRSVVLGTPVAVVAGQAVLPAATFSAGTHSVTAVYLGDSNFAASTSAATALSISTVATVSTAGLSASTITTAQSDTVTVTVTAAAGTPSGKVQFELDGNSLGAPVALAGGTASFLLSALVAGTHTVDALYAGDGTFAASRSAPVNLLVTQAPLLPSMTTITIVPSTIVATTGTTLISAAVTGSGPTPTGSVTLMQGTNSLGTLALSGGQVGGQLSGVSAGVFSLYMVYSGDRVYAASTSAPAILSVTGVGIAPSPASLIVSAGAATGNTSSISFSSIAGFTGAVNVSCAVTANSGAVGNYPPTCSLASPTVTLGAGAAVTDVLTVSTTTPRSLGSNGFADNRGAPMGLVGGSALCAVLLLLLPGRRRAWGKWKALSLLLLLGAGLLSASGCGGASTASTPPVLVGTTPGSYTVTITASSGSGSFTSTVALTVQ